MNSRAIQTPEAARDLYRRASYLHDDSPATAARFVRAADAAFRKLAQFPYLGGSCEFRNPAFADLRVFQIKRFPRDLVFYRPIPGGVLIVRVLHSSQDFESTFEQVD